MLPDRDIPKILPQREIPKMLDCKTHILLGHVLFN